MEFSPLVAWIDADAIIMDHRKSFSELASETSKLLFLTNDYDRKRGGRGVFPNMLPPGVNPKRLPLAYRPDAPTYLHSINSGVFIIRRHNWTETLLNEVFHNGLMAQRLGRLHMYPLSEQSAIMEYRDRNLDGFKKWVKVLPWEKMNSKYSKYLAGDFVQHFAGVSPMGRKYKEVEDAYALSLKLNLCV
eukprot:gene28748-35678_t